MNDPVGFLTGWVLFLDYFIVIALAGLFLPHYVGTAIGWEARDGARVKCSRKASELRRSETLGLAA